MIGKSSVAHTLFFQCSDYEIPGLGLAPFHPAFNGTDEARHI
jgi:hypothetical protein